MPSGSMDHARALPLSPTMSGPFMTNTWFAMAIHPAAMARMAPAITASPPPMKSLVTVALDMVVPPSESNRYP